jgi:hypothetical protein
VTYAVMSFGGFIVGHLDARVSNGTQLPTAALQRFRQLSEVFEAYPRILIFTTS